MAFIAHHPKGAHIFALKFLAAGEGGGGKSKVNDHLNSETASHERIELIYSMDVDEFLSINESFK